MGIVFVVWGWGYDGGVGWGGVAVVVGEQEVVKTEINMLCIRRSI